MKRKDKKKESSLGKWLNSDSNEPEREIKPKKKGQKSKAAQQTKK